MVRRIILNAVVGMSAGMLITGCAATRPQSRMERGRADVKAAPQPPVGDTQSLPAEPTDALELEQALALALMHNPALAAYSYAVRAAEARSLQARVLPKPEIELEIEEYDRGGEGFNSTETAVVLGQRFELGGKRRWRTNIAKAKGELAGWDYERERLDILAETAQRFAAVVATQQRLALSKSTVELAEKTNHAVSERVNAGKEPPLQASKAAAELAMVRIEEMEAVISLQSARLALAAMWGAETPHFETVAGDIGRTLESIPSLAELRPHLNSNPRLARWDSEISLRRSALGAAKAARVPNLKASVGYMQYEEDGTDAFAVGVGLKLPLFDRNRGGIAAAGLALAKAEAERKAVETTLSGMLAKAHAALTLAQRRVATLRASVVPAMESAFEAAREGYRQGKFGFLDVLDAQRGMFEAQGALLDALAAYHAAVTEIERLTGTGSIEALSPGPCGTGVPPVASWDASGTLAPRGKHLVNRAGRQQE